MMDVKKQKPGHSAAKRVPSKPARKKRRIFLWLFLVLFTVVGIAGASFYFRLIPMDPETAEKLEPYVIRAEEIVKGTGELLEKMKVWKNPDEEIASGKPKTNFPLVELDESKTTTAPPVVAAPTNVLGSPAIASAAPSQPAAGATGSATPPVPVKESADSVKVYGKLAKLYGAMKPEEAVAVFNNLEDAQVVMILSRMEEEAAGRVLATIEPKRAARLTQAMIKRK